MPLEEQSGNLTVGILSSGPYLNVETLSKVIICKIPRQQLTVVVFLFTAILVPLPFHINCRIILAISTKVLAGPLIGIALNLELVFYGYCKKLQP